MNLRLPALACFLGLSFCSAVDSAPIDICEHKICPGGNYDVVQTPRCDRKCVPNPEPPGVDWIDCRYGWSGYQCAIWPRGDEISYSYSVSPGLQLSWTGPTYSPFVTVNCPGIGRGGTLVVTVTSPYGMSSSDSISLPCRQTIER
jgi:hypothetical protein